MKKVFVFMFFFFITFINVYAEEYLKDILIDGVSITDFKTDKTSYDLNVKGDKESIKITYQYDINIYQGMGSYGDVNLKYGLNQLSYTLTNKENKESLTYKINITREDVRDSDNSLSSLNVGGTNVKLSDKEEYDVYVDSKLTNVEVKATLSSTKSKFVNGYGERIGNNKVKLSGEKTKIEIKVEAENEKIKTYVINIIKKDYKSNDATIKSLKIENVNLNFKSNIYEYNQSVLYVVDKIKIEALPNHDKATITGTGEIKLKEGINNLVISCKAEDGTVKEYKVNITREKEIPIVNSIEIENVDFYFDPLKYEYDIETDLDVLEFNIVLNSKTATYEILNNEVLKNGSVVSIKIKEENKTLEYKFNIKKEENIEDNEEDNKNLDDDKEKDNQKEENNFLKKYEMYIGLGVFGIGLLSLLVAILTKPKNSQIM